MKRLLFLGWVCMYGVLLFAQEDPVLMRINGSDISRSEFESAYRQYCLSVDKKTTPKEYADIFIGRKLKMEVAKVSGMDTTMAFRKQQESYRSQLLKSFLVDERVADSCARVGYDKLKAGGRTSQVQVMQIFKRLPQAITSRQLYREQARMDSIYHLTINPSDPDDFTRLVEQFSDEKSCVWIESLQTTSEFENVAFSLTKGEISKPFLTPEGIYILKLVDRKEMPGYEELSNQLLERTMRVQGLDKATETALERLKKDCRYSAYTAGMEELLSKGETQQPLFTIDEKEYTGVMLKRFATAHPQSLKRQLDGFIAKSLLDYESKNVEKKHPELNNTFQENAAETLVAQLIHQKLDEPVANDRAGLSTYFKFHQSDYRWTSPRYKGAVLHCVDKKTAKMAKKLVKKLPQQEWAEALRKTFNTSGQENIKVEQGLFADGDNKYIDKLVFKKGIFEPLMSYPFTVAVGKKQKGPDDYRMVIDQVRKDYRNYLDACWTRELRSSSKVEINQEVLKTVNNN